MQKKFSFSEGIAFTLVGGSILLTSFLVSGQTTPQAGPDVKISYQISNNCRRATDLTRNAGTIKDTQWTSQTEQHPGWLNNWAQTNSDNEIDCLRVKLSKGTPYFLDKDFRVGIQLSDNQCQQKFGPQNYTPWASELTKTDADWSPYTPDGRLSSGDPTDDPECIRFTTETRPWPNQNEHVALDAMRLGIQLIDGRTNQSCGVEEGVAQFTPWTNDSNSGQWSSWTSDLSFESPECVRIKLETRETKTPIVVNPEPTPFFNVDPPSKILKKGDEFQMHAYFDPDGFLGPEQRQEVTTQNNNVWSSDDTATVGIGTTTGIIKGSAVGGTNIHASYSDPVTNKTYSDSANIVVIDSPVNPPIHKMIIRGFREIIPRF